MATAAVPLSLKESQRAWIRNVRDKCEDELCMAAAYKQRLVELAGVGGKVGEGVSAERNSGIASTSGSDARTPLQDRPTGSGPPSQAHVAATPQSAELRSQPAPQSAAIERDVPQAVPAVRAENSSAASLLALIAVVVVGVTVGMTSRRLHRSIAMSVGLGVLFSVAGLFALVVFVDSDRLGVTVAGLSSAAKGDEPLGAGPFVIVPEFAHLRFGATKSALPPGYRHVEKSAAARQLEQGAANPFVTPVECYRRDGQPSDSGGLGGGIQKVVLCFDAAEHLSKVVVMMKNDKAVFDRIRAAVVQQTRTEGERGDDAAMSWYRPVQGGQASVGLVLLPEQLMYTENLHSDPQLLAELKRLEAEFRERKRQEEIAEYGVAKAALKQQGAVEAIQAVEAVIGRMDESCRSRIGDNLTTSLEYMKNVRHVWGADVLHDYRILRAAEQLTNATRKVGCVA